jgi:ribosomal protein S18 acetylase RimI-like enzyme
MKNKTSIRSRLVLSDGREIVIRRPDPQDEQALIAFFDSLSPQSRRLFLPHQTTIPVIRRRIERSMLGEDLVYLAWDGQTVAGYFFLWNFADPVSLLGIGIADNYQGLKLGQQFMAILIEDARQGNRDGIELTTMQDNDRAFHVYQKMGFQYLGDVENEIGDGTIVIERAMFLPLREGAKPMSGKHRCPD